MTWEHEICAFHCVGLGVHDDGCACAIMRSVNRSVKFVHFFNCKAGVYMINYGCAMMHNAKCLAASSDLSASSPLACPSPVI